MAIRLNGGTTVTINEATPGIDLGTLTGGNGTYEIYYSEDFYTGLFDTDSTNAQLINGNTLSLSNNWFLDFETKKYTTLTVTQQNGYVSQWSYNAYTPVSAGADPTVRIRSGGEDQIFTISITDKTETTALTTPTPFKQNHYGATIAQIAPSDSYFSSVYFTGPSFLEISGTNLKLTNDYYYSEDGWIKNSAGSGYNTAVSSQFADLQFIIPGGFSSGSTDGNSDGTTDIGTPVVAASSYLSSFFGSSNVNTTPEVTISAVAFVERDYGAVIATLSYSGTETVTYSLATHAFLEMSGSNQIKLKDAYYYDKTNSRIEDQNGTFYALSTQGITYNKLKITAQNAANSMNLVTEEITIDEMIPTVFASGNVDATAQITLTPTSFNDKEYGAIIASINYSGSETPGYSISNHSFLELLNGDKIKLKDSFYYDHNTGRVVKEDFSGYQLSEQANSNKINILATEAETSKNLSSELFLIGDLLSSVFGSSNVVDRDESYTYVTDIKFQATTLAKTGREEYQKNITSQWILGSGEKISYSFLEPGAAYIGTYNEMDGLISTSDSFKTAARNAFDAISSFLNLTFEEEIETGNIVGDFRIGLTDADHFGMESQYAAYSQGVSNSPTAGNIFFNGGRDTNNNGTPDYNEVATYDGNSGAFTTFIHEILHSLGQKHPFEAINSADSAEGNANIYQNQYEQYPYTVMSYTPLRDTINYGTQYDGINLSSGGVYYPTTPMLYDVMALQEVYGSRTSHSVGDDVYTYLPSSPPFYCLYDTGGNDVIDLSNISGGAQLNLSGNKMSIIGDDYLVPWETESGQATTYGAPQGAPLGIISGTEIEKVILPNGSTNITTGAYSTFIVGKENEAITVNINATQLGLKANGVANDAINLQQTSTTWESDFLARNMGNNGKGATGSEISDMTVYLKHDLSLDLKNGTDTLQATSGNDALFLQNFGTTGDPLFYEDSGSNPGGARLLGVDTINLLEGRNFLDLTSSSTSLSGENITITSGTGNDILWLSDANETINAGNGDDQITVNGGTDVLATSLGSDIITISDYFGNLTITDFDIYADSLIFRSANSDVSVSGNIITVDNVLGDYIITLSNSPDLSNLSSFSTFT